MVGGRCDCRVSRSQPSLHVALRVVDPSDVELAAEVKMGQRLDDHHLAQLSPDRRCRVCSTALGGAKPTSGEPSHLPAGRVEIERAEKWLSIHAGSTERPDRLDGP